MVVSLDRGDPNPYYGNPLKGTPNIRKPPNFEELWCRPGLSNLLRNLLHHLSCQLGLCLHILRVIFRFYIHPQLQTLQTLKQPSCGPQQEVEDASKATTTCKRAQKVQDRRFVPPSKATSRVGLGKWQFP